MHTQENISFAAHPIMKTMPLSKDPFLRQSGYIWAKRSATCSRQFSHAVDYLMRDSFLKAVFAEKASVDFYYRGVYRMTRCDVCEISFRTTVQC